MNHKKGRTLLLVAVSTAIIFIGFILNQHIQKSIFYPLKYFDIVSKYADKYNIDPLLILSLIKAESGFNPNVISPKGAKGLMQLQDKTAKWCADALSIKDFEPEKLFDPDTNIMLGTWYFGKYLLDYYSGNTTLALAAYNAGVGNVDKWLGNKKISDGVNLNKIPFEETHTYVNKIYRYHNRYKHLYKN